MSPEARQRLSLYILIGTLPDLIGWLTLTFDWTPRGVAIIVCKLLLAACINWRAFIDGTGKKGDAVETPATPVAPPAQPLPVTEEAKG